MGTFVSVRVCLSMCVCSLILTPTHPMLEYLDKVYFEKTWMCQRFWRRRPTTLQGKFVFSVESRMLTQDHNLINVDVASTGSVVVDVVVVLVVVDDISQP